MIQINEITIQHRTSVPLKSLMEYFYRPEKIKSWFANSDATCTARPDKQAVEIAVLQDHYLEWIFPNTFTTALENQLERPQSFHFYQVDYCLDAPVISKVTVTTKQDHHDTVLTVTISGNYSVELKQDILNDWQWITKLQPAISGSVS